jgi:outer membrane protein assembly factor BamB
MCSEDPHPIAISADGTRVFLAGNRWGPNRYRDMIVVAFDAHTGAKLWASVYRATRRSIEGAFAIAVAPDSSRVFVTGSTERRRRPVRPGDIATVAFDASTGRRLWSARYTGPGRGGDVGIDVAVVPDSSRVFVTGQSPERTYGHDCITLGYDATSGAQLWAARYDGPAHRGDRCLALSVSPDGLSIYVIGGSTGLASGRDFLTIAYSTERGTPRWIARYDGPSGLSDQAYAVAVRPDGAELFVTGTSIGARTDGDFATVAYTTG